MILLAAEDGPSVRSVEVARFNLGLPRRRKEEDLLLDVDGQKLRALQAPDDHFRIGSVHVGLSYLRRDAVPAAVEPEKFSGFGKESQGDRLGYSGLVSASGVDDQHPVLQLAFHPDEADLGSVDVADVKVPADPVEGDAVGVADDAGVGLGEEQGLLASAHV